MSLLQFLIPLAIASATAQAGTPATTADVVVSGHQWGKVVSKTVITDRGPITLNPDVRLPPRRPGTPPPILILRREAYALVRNAGTRTVKAVRWAYVFYADAAHNREVARFEFRSKETLKPGEMKFLTGAVQDSAPSAYDTVVVEDVEFEGAQQ